jgi:hypothetical protein
MCQPAAAGWQRPPLSAGAREDGAQGVSRCPISSFKDGTHWLVARAQLVRVGLQCVARPTARVQPPRNLLTERSSRRAARERAGARAREIARESVREREQRPPHYGHARAKADLASVADGSGDNPRFRRVLHRSRLCGCPFQIIVSGKCHRHDARKTIHRHKCIRTHVH